MDTPNVPGTAPVFIQDDEEDRQPTNVAEEFLKFHLKFNHCSSRKIQVMADKAYSLTGSPPTLSQYAVPANLVNLPNASGDKYMKERSIG